VWVGREMNEVVSFKNLVELENCVCETKQISIDYTLSKQRLSFSYVGILLFKCRVLTFFYGSARLLRGAEPTCFLLSTPNINDRVLLGSDRLWDRFHGDVSRNLFITSLESQSEDNSRTQIGLCFFLASQRIRALLRCRQSSFVRIFLGLRASETP